MKAKRRRHDSAFKARVAIEAMKDGKTIHQITKENEIHPTQVTDWKKTLAENIGLYFAPHDRLLMNISVERESSKTYLPQISNN